MPTIKQRKAMKALVGNGGNISAAMREAGYTVSMAHHTEKLTQSKGFQELLEEYLPDSDLVKVHQEGLLATRIHTSHTEPDQIVPDFAVRHKYLDTAYKVKGKIKDDSTTEVKMLILRLDV